jgi:hypothetical protein
MSPTMKKVPLALAPALADNPSDPNQGAGNDPPSRTGGGKGGRRASRALRATRARNRVGMRA